MPSAPLRTPTHLTMGAMGTSTTDTSTPSGPNQQYEYLRKQLCDLIAKKRQSDKTLEGLEDHIHKYETTYLEDTQNGNIVRGFDNYIKGTVARRRATITDQDRIFS